MRNPGLAHRTDRNQSEVVKALRAECASVLILSTVGDGCPDLLVGFRGRNLLLEVKDGAKVPSKRRLTPDQKLWRSVWSGQVNTVESVAEALIAVGVY